MVQNTYILKNVFRMWQRLWFQFSTFCLKKHFPQVRLRLSQPLLREYWCLVLDATFNQSNFSCSFLHFDCRLKTCRRGWHFDNLACRNIDFSFWAQSLIQNFSSSFVDFVFSAQYWMKTHSAVCCFSSINGKRKLQPKRFVLQI